MYTSSIQWIETDRSEEVMMFDAEAAHEQEMKVFSDQKLDSLRENIVPNSKMNDQDMLWTQSNDDQQSDKMLLVTESWDTLLTPTALQDTSSVINELM